MVTAREAVELFLILYYTAECVRRAGDRRPLPLLLGSTAIGIGLGAGAAGWLETDLVPAWAAALLSVLVASMIIVLVSGGLETVSRIRRSIDARFDGLPLSTARTLAVAMALLAGFREAFECSAQVGLLARAMPAADVAIAASAAIGLTSCLAWAGPLLHEAVGTKVLFRASAVVLMLIAADMLIDALGALAAVALDASDLSHHLAVSLLGDLEGGASAIGPIARAALMAALLVLTIQRWWRESR